MSDFAVFHLSDEEERHVSGLLDDNRSSFELALTSRALGQRVALFFNGNSLSYYALATKLTRAGELRSNFRISQFARVERPFRVAVLKELLTDRQADALLAPGGDLTEGATRGVLRQIEKSDKGLHSQLMELIYAAEPTSSSVAKSLRYEQRDHVTTALSMAGMDAQASIERIATRSPSDSFLPSSEADRPFEDDMIFHDMRLFEDWTATPDDRLGHARFEDDDGRQMEMWSINRKRAEEISGAVNQGGINEGA